MRHIETILERIPDGRAGRELVDGCLVLEGGAFPREPCTVSVIPREESAGRAVSISVTAETPITPV